MSIEDIDVAILGAGTAGLSARAETAKKTDSYMVFDPGPLGTTCARVACMPSKAFVQSAHDFHRRHAFKALGIRGADRIAIDAGAVLSRTRRLRDGFVDGVLRNMDSWRAEHLISQAARFADDGVLVAGDRRFRPRATVVATGTRPVVPPDWRETLGDSILTSDDFFELETLPRRIAVIGMGPQGLELGQALARLGVEVTGFDPSPDLGGLSHPDLQQLARDVMQSELRLISATATPESGENGTVRMVWDEGELEVDRVLVAMGRTPNIEKLGLDNLGIEIEANGVLDFDHSSLNVPGTRVFLAGDVSGIRPLLHEAADEGRIAGYNAARAERTAFARRIPLQITFTEPQIAGVGENWQALEDKHADIAVGAAALTNSGRSQVARTGAGAVRIYAEKATARLIGVELFTREAEHLAHLFAFALQQRALLTDLLQMPFYHPTHEEAVRRALRHAVDQCDVSPEPFGLERFRCEDTPVDAGSGG